METAAYTEQDLTPEDRAALGLVKKRKELSEKTRQPYLERWKRWYGLHRNYRRYADAHQSANTRSDKDEVMNDAKRAFGAELFIPMIFTTIETVLARMLMNDPAMKAKPARPDYDPARLAGPKYLFESREADIGFARKLQPTARRGLKYGLGVNKTLLEDRRRTEISMERGVFGAQVQKPVEKQISHGPTIESVELWDFFWDPAAIDMETSRYAIHRVWRDPAYVKSMVESKKWRDLDLERIKGMGSQTARGDMLAERADAMGMTDFERNQGDFHEVWEYHDGDRVITILDGVLVVQDAPSPFNHRELPFQIFRPTLMEGEFVGIGEVEPIEHLQYELNTLRSQRRDNATMVLQKAFIYAEGLVNRENLVIGPGVGIPVFGSPDDVIKPLNFGDIPASGYQEENSIKEDIRTVSGVDDAMAGAAGGDETATGRQIVEQAAGLRVRMKRKQLEQETIKPIACQWKSIFRQILPEEGQDVPVEQAGGYGFVNVTPEDIDALAEVIPEAGSTEPDNVPQKRNDALALMNQVGGNPVVDQRKVMRWFLKQMDIVEDDWILPEQTQMNPQVAEVVGNSIRETLLESGVEPEQADEIALEAMQRAGEQTGMAAQPSDVNGAMPPGEPEEAPAP